MIIQCTKKVFDKIGMKDAEKAPDAPTSENEKLKMQLHSWHVNLLTIDRRKVLLFLNDLYSVNVIVYRPQVKDYKHLNEILCEGIETLMRRYGVKEDVGGEYGYNEYLRIINDTADPEYDHILNWSKITRAEEKTDKEINRSLSWIK